MQGQKVDPMLELHSSVLKKYYTKVKVQNSDKSTSLLH